MRSDITFITGNMHKVQALEHWLGVTLKHHKLDLDEIQDLDPLVVVEHKVKQAFEIIKKPVLVEDTALWFHALGRLPGTYIKWFIEEIGTENLCRLLNPFKDRIATASVIYSHYDGDKVTSFTGEVPGTIASLPKGSNGFGWDPIFIPEGSEKTYGEMELDELASFSVRLKAVEKLKKYLDQDAGSL